MLLSVKYTELRPPPSVRRSTSSVPSDGVAIGGQSSLPNFRRGDLLPPTLGNNMISMNRGARFTGPIAITTSTSTSDAGNNYCISSSKEVCRIPMTSMMMSYENVEDEEPPPTYEEALSYGKFLSSLNSSPPYEDDQSVVVQCEANIDIGVNINGDNGSVNNNNANDISTTTAIFVNEEESSEDEDDDDDGDDSESTSNQSANDTDNESHLSVLDEGEDNKWDSNNNNDNNVTSATIDENGSVICKMLDNVANNNSHVEQTKQTQCNEKNLHVILSPSSSTSKSLDRFEIDYDLNEKKRISSSCSNAREKIKSSSPPPKLVSPSTHPGNVV